MMHGNSTKQCRGCKSTFPLDQFASCLSTNGKRYPYSYCRKCSTKNATAYHSTVNGKKSLRKRNLKKYGLTIDNYEAILASQGGVCAICQKAETYGNLKKTGTRRLAVDHSHSPGGKTRGILCSRCNTGLANFLDRPELLRLAAEYLERYLTQD